MNASTFEMAERRSSSRAFSVMPKIMTTSRYSLNKENMANLVFLKLNFGKIIFYLDSGPFQFPYIADYFYGDTIL